MFKERKRYELDRKSEWFSFLLGSRPARRPGCICALRSEIILATGSESLAWCRAYYIIGHIGQGTLS